MPLEQEKSRLSTLTSSPEEKVSKKDSLKEDISLPQDISESIGMAEEIEAMGHVSEKAKKSASEQSGGGTSSQKFTKTQAQNIQQIRNNLVRQMPKNRKVMAKQVEKHIQKKINELHRNAMKIVKAPASKANYFELNNIVKQIRVLKGILNSLFKASMKKVRTLWLRYVAGIM
ncbi:hypothetical protein GF354_01170 [Candidatus Peregrinibacteria bacterium]|nr:hypothetical protein [Candidatus Peregrinibacteria bacterium]